MEQKTASKSAAIIAAHRAIESEKVREDRICYDPLAKKFLPPGFTVIGPHQMGELEALQLFQQIVPGFHEFFLARTRYIDDYLHDSVEAGIQQLVILGAGYDSRAYRFEELLKKKTHIFEVDHPATQAAKKAKLKDIYGSLPSHVNYVGADFLSTDLSSCLDECSFQSNLSTLFILEGVSMYITKETMDEILGFVSRFSGKTSRIVFDYTFPEVVEGTHESFEAKEWLKITQKSGEPLFFGICEQEIESYLVERGFRGVVNCTSEFFSKNYFIGRNAGRESTPILALAHGEV